MNTVTMVKTLVVCEIIPEGIKMALVDLPQEQFNFLSQAHGYVVNVPDMVANPKGDLACFCIHSAFCDDPEHLINCDGMETTYLNKFNGCWLKTQDLTGVQKIIRCGIHL